MKEIQLRNSDKIVLVDDADYEALSKDDWWLSNGYAISWHGRRKMHRVIIGAKKGEIVDHIDRDKLNNQRSNLRIVDARLSAHNRGKIKDTKNNYKGVHFAKKMGLFQSRCRSNGSDYFLGYYRTEKAAAYAYNKKAMELSDAIVLNQFEESIEELEKILIDDRAKINPTEKQSGVKNIYWNKSKDKWRVVKFVNKKRHHIGEYKSLDDAIIALNNFMKTL